MKYNMIDLTIEGLLKNKKVVSEIELQKKHQVNVRAKNIGKSNFSILDNHKKVSFVIKDDDDNVYFRLEGKRQNLMNKDEITSNYCYFITKFEYDLQIQKFKIFNDTLIDFENFIKSVFVEIEENEKIGRINYVWAVKQSEEECMVAKLLNIPIFYNDDEIKIYKKEYGDNRYE